MTDELERTVDSFIETWAQLALGSPGHIEFDRALTELVRHAYAAAKAAGWQPIETAPEQADIIIACAASSPPLVGEARLYPDGVWMWANSEPNDEYPVRVHGTPTHWMPLPDPPSGPEAR